MRLRFRRGSFLLTVFKTTAVLSIAYLKGSSESVTYLLRCKAFEKRKKEGESHEGEPHQF